MCSILLVGKAALADEFLLGDCAVRTAALGKTRAGGQSAELGRVQSSASPLKQTELRRTVAAVTVLGPGFHPE